LNWESFQDINNPFIFHRSAVTLSELINELKTVFNIDMLRVIGNLKQIIRNIAILNGSPSCQYFIQALSDENIDAVIGGEFTEWGVGEFARDAVSQNKKVSLIELGHLMSEQFGMEYLVDWLQPKLNGVPIYFIETPNLFSVL